MSDERTVCAAAFFRSMGKDVTTPEEFVMGTSLDMKWMSPSDSKLLLAYLVSGGILRRENGLVKPSSDMSAIDVPLAYRPSEELLAAARGKDLPSTKNPEPATDLFPRLMDVAVSNGMERRDFIQNCNKIQKRLDVDIGVAALIVLRDNGTDITPYVEDAYSYVASS